MKKSRCKKCGEKIVQDDHDSWIDNEGGDVCCEDDGVHEPFVYPSPDTTTIGDDLQAILYEVIENEDDDYDDQCVYQGVEEAEDHIFRAAERLAYFKPLMAASPKLLDALARMLEATERLQGFGMSGELTEARRNGMLLLQALKEAENGND